MTRAEWEVKRWDKKTRSRVIELMTRARRAFGDNHAAVVEHDDGRWEVASIDEQRYPKPFHHLSATSLKALEVEVTMRLNNLGAVT
jgi:hypothetical protein